MPKRSSMRDPNQLAARIVLKTTGGKVALEKKKNPAAVALGRLGGLKGGRARALCLSPKKRTAIAKMAAMARWSP